MYRLEETMTCDICEYNQTLSSDPLDPGRSFTSIWSDGHLAETLGLAETQGPREYLVCSTCWEEKMPHGS